MPSLINIALALIGVGVLGSGGYALNVYLDKEPKHKTIAENESLSFKDNNQLAAIQVNKNQLIDDLPYNQEWWEWKFKNTLGKQLKTTEQSKVHTDFRIVKEGYGKNARLSLNRVCSNMWNLTNLKDEKLKESIEKYCTTGRTPKLSTSETMKAKKDNSKK